MEKAQRLISLDVLRGITIAGMIIVNNPGSWKHVYTPLTHAVWNGLTPTDLVFPFFMFIMGISTYISLKKFNFSFSLPLIKKVVKRTILLFLIGLFINWCAKGMCSFQELRIPGVLQRLALCYFFTVIICTNIHEKYIPALITVLLLIYQIILGEFYQFNLSSCIRQQNSLTAQFVSFSLSNLANIFYPPQFLQ